MVDESVIGYSADGKDRPWSSVHVCCPASFFFFFLSFGLNMRPQVVFLFTKVFNNRPLIIIL